MHIGHHPWGDGARLDRPCFALDYPGDVGLRPVWVCRWTERESGARSRSICAPVASRSTVCCEDSQMMVSDACRIALSAARWPHCSTSPSTARSMPRCAIPRIVSPVSPTSPPIPRRASARRQLSKLFKKSSRRSRHWLACRHSTTPQPASPARTMATAMRAGRAIGGSHECAYTGSQAQMLRAAPFTERGRPCLDQPDPELREAGGQHAHRSGRRVRNAAVGIEMGAAVLAVNCGVIAI